MPDTAFDVSRFENRNGVISWRVSGWLHGLRIRKNFKTREEAAAEKAALEIKALQATSGLRSVATTLSDEQAREAEAAFRRLADKPRPLSFYLDFALANYREPERASKKHPHHFHWRALLRQRRSYDHGGDRAPPSENSTFWTRSESQKSLSEAIADYKRAKAHEHEQGQLSTPQLGHIGWDLKRLYAHFPKRSVAELTLPAIVAFLEIGRPGMKTYNNRGGIVSTFFKYAFHRGWIAENPLPKVPHYRIRRKRGSAVTFTTAQAAELMEHFETFEGGRWVPYFALCLFAGIRPGVPHGEITKIRPADVNLDTGIISISADVSKFREPRRIAIQPNLAAWLRAYPLTKFPIVVGNFKKRREKFRDRFNLSHDVLRHTFISMFVAKFRSIGEAAIQAGNSESIIRRHYLDLKSTEEGAAFFDIMPKHAAAAILASFCARIRAHPNPLLAFDAACFASGLMDVEGLRGRPKSRILGGRRSVAAVVVRAALTEQRPPV